MCLCVCGSWLLHTVDLLTLTWTVIWLFYFAFTSLSAYLYLFLYFSAFLLQAAQLSLVCIWLLFIRLCCWKFAGEIFNFSWFFFLFFATQALWNKISLMHNFLGLTILVFFTIMLLVCSIFCCLYIRQIYRSFHSGSLLRVSQVCLKFLHKFDKISKFINFSTWHCL